VKREAWLPDMKREKRGRFSYARERVKREAWLADMKREKRDASLTRERE
jgi:hypothetical protein